MSTATAAAATTSKGKYSTNVNTQLIDTLSSILEKIDRESKIPGRQPEVTELSAFLDHPYNRQQLVQSWSYFANVNDHSSLSNCTTKLAKLLHFANGVLALHSSALELINEIISGPNLKVFYRSLNNTKPSLTNPALRLMSEIVLFANGSQVDKFLDGFDLNLKILPQLVVPSKAELAEPSKFSSKDTIRSTFFNFWLNLCNNANPLTRKGLLINNKKIMTNLLKYLTSHEPIKILTKFLTFVDEKILQEIAYKKMTKCKIFTEFMLKKFIDLYSVTDLRSNVHQFLIRLTTDYKIGIPFTEEKIWFNYSLSETDIFDSASASNGVPVAVGDRTFKIYNKLIYNMLTSLRPWADDLQLDLTINILGEVPELLSIYNYYLSFSNGYHDPKLSSFWIGQSLLLTRIVNSPIPKKFSDLLKLEVRKNQQLITSTNDLSLTGSKLLSASTLADAIFPTQLNRTALTKGLTSEHQLIKHTVSQLIVACLNKVEKTLALLTYSNSVLFSTVKAEFLELVLKVRLPELKTVLETINEVVKDDKNNKYLLLNLLKLTEQYAKVMGQVSPVALPNEILKLDDQSGFKGIDLLILDSYLQIQKESEAEFSQQKWWNVSKGAKNTLFTTITRLPYDISENNPEPVDRAVFQKIIDILSSLVDSTIIFTSYKSPTTNILESQVYSLVMSFEQFPSIVKTKNVKQEVEYLCEIIDEAISRCVKTPYKYLDIAQELSEDTRSYPSPFFVAFVEQSKFYKGDKGNIIRWVNLLARNLSLLGESPSSLNKIISKFYSDEKPTNHQVRAVLPFEYENSISLLDSNNRENRQSFFEFVVASPIKTLNKELQSKFAISDYDIVGVLKRCQYIVESDKLSLKDSESVLIELVSKYGNYLFQKNDLSASTVSISNLPLLASKYWSKLFISKEVLESNKVSEKRILVSSMLNEVFSNIHSLHVSSHGSNFKDEKIFDDLRSCIVELLTLFESTEVQFSTSIEKIVCDSFWVLDAQSIVQFLNISKYQMVRSKLLYLAVERGISLDEQRFGSIISGLNETTSEILGKVALNIDLSVEATKQIFKNCFEDKSKGYLYYPIIESLISKSTSNADLLFDEISLHESSLQTRKQDLSFYTVLLQINNKLPICELIRQKSLEGVNSIVDSGKIEGLPILEYLTCLNNFEEFDNDTRTSMIKSLLNIDSFNNDASLVFSKQFVLFVSKLSDLNEKSATEYLKPWLHRGILYITKVFAETTSDILAPQFLEFLTSLKEIYFTTSVWRLVPKSVLNSQLEVILSKEKWIQLPEAVEYCIYLVINSQKNEIDYSRAFQLLINNPKNPLNEETNSLNFDIKCKTAILTQSIFKFDMKSFSTYDVQMTIIRWYSGSVLAHDLILKNIMVDIESQSERSWVSYVSNWDYQEDSETLGGSSFKLVSHVAGTSGLTVTLSNLFVNNTINKFNCSSEEYKVPSFDKISKNNVRAKWDMWTKFMHHSHVTLSTVIEGYEFKNTVYDSEFVLLLILNNEELFGQEDTSFKIDIKKLIENDLLQLIVVNLSNINEKIRLISRQLLSSCFMNLMEQIEQVEKIKSSKPEDGNMTGLQKLALSFKERDVFKVYLGNILNTLAKLDADAASPDAAVEGGEQAGIPPINVMMLSHLISVLNNPSHFLYEKTYRYILNGSSFRSMDIPLYKSITQSFTVDPRTGRSAPSSGISSNDDQYYKLVSWLLNKIELSLTSFKDLKPINRSGLLEWVLSLTSSPFVSFGLQNQILRVLFKIQDIPNGSDLLIRNYGLLAFTELQKSKILHDKAVANVEIESKGNNAYNKRTNRELVMFDFSLLNYQNLAVRSEIGSSASGSDKRAREWTNEDIGRSVKRVLLS